MAYNITIEEIQNGITVATANNLGVNVTVEEVVNGITITPPVVNQLSVSNIEYPVTISYNGIIVQDGGGQAVNGIPSGGSIGQFLRKTGTIDYDTAWANITDINTTYSVSAETATGGANLRLTGSNSSTDDVKLAAGSGITVSRTDANTITIASTVVDTDTTYAISAETVTGGANLRLSGSDSSTDNVKIASGTGINIVRTDANTVTVNSTIVDTDTKYSISAETATGGVNLRLSGTDTLTDNVKFAAGSNVTITRTDADTITIAAAAASIPSINYNSTSNRTTITGSNVNTGDLAQFAVNGPDYGFEFQSTRGFSVGTQTQNILVDGSVNGAIAIQSNGTGSIGLTAGSSANSGSQLVLGSGSGDAILRGGEFGGGGNITVGGAANSNISITPTGTGDVQLNADTVRIGDVSAAATITTNGLGNLTLSTNSGTNSGSIVINQGINGNITLSPNGSGRVLTDKRVRITSGAVDAFQITDGTSTLEFSALDRSMAFNGTGAAYVYTASGDLSLNAGGGSSRILLGTAIAISNNTVNAGLGVTTQGSTQDLVLSTNNATNSGTIRIVAGTNGNISITPNGSGSILLDGQRWPQADGTSNQVLRTNGSGQLSWVSINSLGLDTGITQVQDDSTPTLGGNLNVNNYTIVNTQTNGDVKIAGSGTGKVKLSNIAYPNTDGSAGQVLKTDGSGSLGWADKQDPTIVNDSQPNVQSQGQHWYRPVTGAMYTARNGAWEPINDDGFF